MYTVEVSEETYEVFDPYDALGATELWWKETMLWGDCLVVHYPEGYMLIQTRKPGKPYG